MASTMPLQRPCSRQGDSLALRGSRGYAEYQRGGGKSETVVRGPLPDRRAALANNIMHWGYGIATGAAYGVVAESTPRPQARYGAVFGAGVWGTSYVVLPAAKLY